MLPFLKPKAKSGGSSMLVVERKPDDDMPEAALEAAAQDILRAISSKDYKHLAMALKAAFEICDSQPHEEGPHLNDEDSYYEGE